MKAQELRIGNLVNYNGNHKHIGIVYGLMPKIFIDEFHQINYSDELKISINNRHDILYALKDIKPIPLTEEWLLKFGFVKKEGWDDQEYYELNGFKLFIIESGFEYEDTALKFVHRLQNLYYEIKDQELTLKQK